MNNIITHKSAARKLQGKAIPDLLKAFEEQVKGQKIVTCGYTEIDGMAVPVLTLSNGVAILVWCDDEENNPGVLRTTGGARTEILPHTTFRK